MKIIFRYGFLIILLAILAAVLFRKKEQIAIVSSGAKYSDYEIPVQTTPVKPAIPSSTIQSGGIVESSEEVIVISSVQGKVIDVNVIVGKKVKAGDVVATCDDFMAMKEFSVAKEAHQQLQKDYNRYEKLAEEDAVAKQQLEQLKLQLEGADAKQQMLARRLDDTKIKAPVSGIVNQVFIKQGASIGTGTPVCEIVNPDGLKITGHVGKNDIGLLKSGANVRLSENFSTGKTYTGIIAGTGVKPDRTGRYPFSVAITSTSAELKPGTILNVEIESSADPAIMVPRKVVQYKNGNYGVFVAEKGIAVFKNVETGKSHGDHVEIAKGLEEGMLLITDGYQFLEAGSKLKTEQQ